MPMSPILYALIAIAGALFVGTVVVPRRRRAALLPPGPPGVPFLGHLLRMPTVDVPTVLHEWSKVYGDVMHLQIPGRRLIVLDSYRATVDLLEKRGSIYSDRPKFTLYELLGWDPSLTFLSYSKFGKQRQMHQSYLSRQKVEEFKSVQTQEARALIRNLLGCKPDEYEKYIGRMATGIITQIVAGHRITTHDDPYLRLSHMVLQAMSKTGPPGNSPLDFFSWLQHFPAWFPGAEHAGVVKRWKSTVRELYDFPLRTVKEQQKRGEATPSFLLDLLEQLDEGDDDSDLKGAAATMFSAGEATTWSTISSFIIAMVLNPECQAKAQREIDSVVGASRLPNFEDREKLPFVECLVQEILRSNPPVPLCVPHRVMKDDMYRGMLIPEGSLVFANIRAMGLDETMYANPSVFYPERFLPKPTGNGEPYFSSMVFGFGRRICTGRYVAENNLWITIASILACCEISNARDVDGKVIVPDRRLTDGLVSHPTDMRCVISARSPQAKALIMEYTD